MRRTAAFLLLLVPSSILACGSGAGPTDDNTAPEAQTATDGASLAPLDSTQDELARASQETRAFEHELTMFAIPAPKLTGLSWATPGSLARGTLFNEGLGLSRGIGHAAVRVDCGATADKPAAHFQGSMTDTGNEFRDMVITEQAGLGVLLRTVAGELEKEEVLQSTLDSRYADDGRVAFLRIGISSDVCRGLLDYVKDYDARDVEKNYGFVRPSFQEGAGCSAFTLSFMKLANLVEPYMNAEWKFDVLIPMTLIGGASNPGNKVPVTRLLMLGRPWATPAEPHVRLNGWDPTLMYKSIRTRTKNALANGSTP